MTLIDEITHAAAVYPAEAARFIPLSSMRKRLMLFESTDFRCATCGLKHDNVITGYDNNKKPLAFFVDESHTSILTKGHIIPIHRGGTGFLRNLRPLCNTCNYNEGCGLTHICEDKLLFKHHLKGTIVRRMDRELLEGQKTAKLLAVFQVSNIWYAVLAGLKKPVKVDDLFIDTPLAHTTTDPIYGKSDLGTQLLSLADGLKLLPPTPKLCGLSQIQGCCESCGFEFTHMIIHANGSYDVVVGRGTHMYYVRDKPGSKKRLWLCGKCYSAHRKGKLELTKNKNNAEPKNDRVCLPVL